jgi:hypothetical protein
MARQAILDSAIYFCEQTLTLRQSLDNFNTIKGLVEYALDSPNNQMKISRVLSVSIDGKRIKGLFEEDEPLLGDQTGKPTCFYTSRVDSEFVLKLYPEPDNKYDVSVTVALAPTRNASALEDDLHDLWVEGIAAGAVSILTKIPNMPFTNTDLAFMKDVEASRCIQKAKSESYYGRVRGGTRVKTRPIVR